MRYLLLLLLGLSACVKPSIIGEHVGYPYHVEDPVSGEQVEGLHFPEGQVMPAEAREILSRMRLYQGADWYRLCVGTPDCCLVWTKSGDPVTVTAPTYPDPVACTWHEGGHVLTWLLSEHKTWDEDHEIYMWLWNQVRYGPPKAPNAQ